MTTTNKTYYLIYPPVFEFGGEMHVKEIEVERITRHYLFTTEGRKFLRSGKAYQVCKSREDVAEFIEARLQIGRELLEEYKRDS